MKRVMFQRLHADKLIATSLSVARKVKARFPESGLSQVAAEVLQVAEASQSTTDELKRPIWPLRIINVVLSLGIAGLLGYVLLLVGPSIRVHSLEDFIQVLEPALGSIVFIGAFILFVWGLETRWKRDKALDRLHELRSLAHVIDMHQLTKDPSSLACNPTLQTEDAQLLTGAELHDYLDYCSELLSIIGKIGALYAQDLHESGTLEAADRVESLTVGLSRKIWQKMLVLETNLTARQP